MTDGRREDVPEGSGGARYTAAAGLDAGTWQVLADLHRVVSGFAGRLPDALVAQLRTWIAEQDVVGLAEVVVASAIAKGLTVSTADAEVLASLPAVPGRRLGLPAELMVSDAVPPLRHRFDAGAPAVRVDGLLTDQLDQTAASALNRMPGAVAVRRAVRAATETAPAHRVYLFEAAPGVALWRLVADAQRALEARGEEAPQVEAYWTSEELTRYQQAAFAASTSLWNRPALPERGPTVFGYALDPARRKHVGEWYRWTEEVWSTLTGLHRLIQRLSPDLPAEPLYDLRRMLALGELGPLAEAVAGAVSEHGSALTADEVALLRGIPEKIKDPGVDLSGLDRVPVGDLPVPAAGHRFAEAPDGGWDPAVESATHTLVSMMAAQPGVAKVWRAWCLDASLPVFLVEVDPGLAAWDVAFDAYLALAHSGLAAVVEAYWPREALPPYRESALGVAEPLWINTVSESPFTGGVRSAGVYDLAADDGQPRFAANHPLLSDPAECDRLAARMLAGRVVVDTPVLAGDVVNPERARIVPLTYHTDGEWIWRLSTAYYLSEYQLSPDPGLLEHLRRMERGAEQTQP